MKNKLNKAICLYLLLMPFIKAFSDTSSKPSIQLATYYKTKEDISHYWISEKLDGIRGFWTGQKLLTRNGNLIFTPSWFTQHWPNIAIDGELWSKRNDFSFIVSCTKQQNPENPCWHNIKFMIFDLPKHQGTFTERINAMNELTKAGRYKHLKMIPQFKIQDTNHLFEKLNQIVLKQGEGLMLHHQGAFYTHGRSPYLMKLKHHQDEEAVVLEIILGKGKYQGKLGALKVKNQAGKTFKIGSGFSDDERSNPPQVGDIITYQYTGKTKNEIPRFARFLRTRVKKP